MNEQKEDKLLKTSKVAEILGVHPNTVLNLLKQNALRGVRLGPRNIRVYQSSVTALLSTGAYGNAG